MAVVSGLLKERLSPEKAVYFNKLTAHGAGGGGGGGVFVPPLDLGGC